MITVDYMTLSSVARCDTQALLRYHLGLTAQAEVPAPLRAGIAFHAITAAWLRGADPNIAVQAAEEYVAWAKGHVDASDRLGPANVLRVFRRFFERYQGDPERLPFMVIDVERRSSVKLAPDVVYVGRLDVVGVMPDGSIWVVDWKTTGKKIAWQKPAWRMSAQFTGYVRILEADLNTRVAGTIVGAVELLKLPEDPKRRCSEHGVVYAECGDLHAQHEMVVIERNDERIATWPQTTLELTRRWEHLKQVYPTLDRVATAPQQGQWTGACKDCEFFEWCRGGRDLAWANAHLRSEPWTPGGPSEGRQNEEN